MVVELPIAYDLSGNDILAKGTKNIPANTPMDVDRHEKQLARDYYGLVVTRPKSRLVVNLNQIVLNASTEVQI